MRPASSPTLAIDRRINPYEYRCQKFADGLYRPQGYRPQGRGRREEKVSSSKRSSKWISSTSRTSKSSPPSREAQRSNTPRSMSTTTSYSSAPHLKGSGSHPQSHSSPVAPSRRLPEPRLRPPGRREASRRQAPSDECGWLEL